MLHCTLEELGERMSAEEMGTWLAWLALEPCDPASTPVLWARLMAALHNGPMVKHDKSRYTANDFLAADRWKAPPVTPSAPPDRKQFAAGLRAMFKRR